MTTAKLKLMETLGGVRKRQHWSQEKRIAGIENTAINQGHRPERFSSLA